MTSTRSKRPSLFAMCASEALGTALLVAVGLSIVIAIFGRDSAVAHVLPSPAARRALAGGLFGATGMAIALSPIGRVSGAHINPVVSLAFFLERALPARSLVAFVASQLVGAAIGAAPLLAWGSMGRSVAFGATAPGAAGVGAAFAGEVITTFALVALLLVCVGHPRVRRFTPGLFPPLYCVMVLLEAPWSGTSTNPARSLTPDVALWSFHGYWLYWVAPVVGTIAALAIRRVIPVVRTFEIRFARVAHFEVERVAELVEAVAPGGDAV